MKKYTIEDLENFEKDKYGCLICPSGDYSEINLFGERCSFGELCSFGERCSFGELCSLENQHKFEDMSEVADRVLKIDCIGSRKGCTYFFKTLSGIYVRCGCFFGTIEQFAKKVEDTHKDNAQYLKEYRGAIEYVKAVM